MTQHSRSSSSISPTNNRSSLKRYNISPTREREIAEKRAKWLKQKKLEEIHNRRKAKLIAKFDMELRKKEEEEERRRRNRSSRENRRDISFSLAGPSNESVHPRGRSSDNRRRSNASPVAGPSNEVAHRRRDSHSAYALINISRSSQSPSRNDHIQRTLNSQDNTNSRVKEKLEWVLITRRDPSRTEEPSYISDEIYSVVEEVSKRLKQEDNRDDEPNRRSPSPQRRRSQLSTSGTSRSLPIKGSNRSSRERSPRRESSQDRPRILIKLTFTSILPHQQRLNAPIISRHRSTSHSRHRHPDSRDSSYRRSNQEGRSQRSPRRHSSSRDHEQYRGYRRPRSPLERAQRDDGGYSMRPLPPPPPTPPPHQHSNAPFFSNYPAAPNLEEWQFPPPIQLHPAYPPIRPPPGAWVRYDAEGRVIEYISPECTRLPMRLPNFRPPPPFYNWRGPRPPPRYHGNRFRHPHPNLHRGNQQIPDTTQRTDANSSTTQPRTESDNDTKNQETSKK